MKEQLSVIAEGRLMGHLIRNGKKFSFRYASSWQNDPDNFPISVSLPLAAADHSHQTIEAFLQGLLPDSNEVLQEWGRRFHVSPNNPFRLLQYVGEDCAGGVQFVDAKREHEFIGIQTKERVTWLDDEQLSERIQLLLKNWGNTRISADSGQFSLAGAQPKTALYRHPDTGIWGIPEGQTPTTHILKPAAGHFDGYAENEHFCLRLAHKLGLQVASSSIIHPGGHPVIVVKRYDRLLRDGRYLRIHQEDICQALSIPPSSKYQNDGGPSVKAVAELLWDHSNDGMTDVLRFADALIFNWLLLGTDAHAKNYSLLIAPRDQTRLAPLYDLSSALPYPKEINIHKTKMSMRIGSKYLTRQIKKRQWQSCAKDLRLPARVLLERIEDLAKKMPAAAKTTATNIYDDGLNHSIIGKLSDAIAERCQTCLDALSEEL